MTSFGRCSARIGPLRGRRFLSIPSVETEHLFRFRVAGSHRAVCVHGLFKLNNFNQRRCQNTRFETSLELVLDVRDRSRSMGVAVYSKQSGGIMIEVNEVESDARISARDCHLSPSNPE